MAAGSAVGSGLGRAVGRAGGVAVGCAVAEAVGVGVSVPTLSAAEAGATGRMRAMAMSASGNTRRTRKDSRISAMPLPAVALRTT